MKFDAELANNPEPRLACVLLLDTSGSMGGAPISELNAGLRVFKEEINEDSLARKRVEVAIVTFGGGVGVTQDFQTVDAFQPPKLGAGGDTPMGTAIHKALDMIRERKEGYKAHGLSYYRPWLFLITDGAPTDAWEGAAERLIQEINGKNVAFFAVGVKGADMNVLAQLSPKRAPLQLEGLKFRELFEWLSNSMSTVSHSGTPTADGDVQAPLPSVSDWAKV